MKGGRGDARKPKDCDWKRSNVGIRRVLRPEERVASIRSEARAEGRAEGEAQARAEWEAWNERRVAAEASGEPFDEPPPQLSANHSE